MKNALYKTIAVLFVIFILSFSAQFAGVYAIRTQ